MKKERDWLKMKQKESKNEWRCLEWMEGVIAKTSFQWNPQGSNKKGGPTTWQQIVVDEARTQEME